MTALSALSALSSLTALAPLTAFTLAVVSRNAPRDVRHVATLMEVSP
jgi:hypothetical protein